MSGGNTIRRRTLSKELRLSQGYVKTKEEYESQNVKYMGSVGAAAKQAISPLQPVSGKVFRCRRMSFRTSGTLPCWLIAM